MKDIDAIVEARFLIGRINKKQSPAGCYDELIERLDRVIQRDPDFVPKFKPGDRVVLKDGGTFGPWCEYIATVTAFDGDELSLKTNRGSCKCCVEYFKLATPELDADE